MAFVSVTRLRLRSLRFLPAFLWHAVRSAAQAEDVPGCLGLRTMRDSDGSFWTVSAWKSPEAMRAYITTGAHRKAMPKLVEWCDEASTVHWEQEEVAVPDWPEACLRMAEEGRPYRLRHMSPEHAARFSQT